MWDYSETDKIKSLTLLMDLTTEEDACYNTTHLTEFTSSGKQNAATD